MVANVCKAPVSAVPPRELNVRKFAESRASELEGLHSIVANRLNNDFRSRRNNRKRTNGHDNRIGKQRFRKKQRIGFGESNNNDSLIKHDKKISRRVRRSNEFKRNPPSGFCTSGDGTKRLRTHVWHAKRFTMAKLWGFHIPLGVHGSGRGSRALLKKLKNGVLIHDASYYGTVQLEGPQDILLSILSSVLVPSPSAHSKETSDNFLSGDIFGVAMRDSTGGSAKCISLDGQLANLELIGSEAFQLLEKTLLPANCVSEKYSFLKKCDFDENNNQGDLENATIANISTQVSSSAVVAFTVKDPRALINKHIFYSSSESVDYNDLWDVREGICPPMEENLVCMEKYYQRMKFIALSNKTSRTSVDGKYSKCCPILLLNSDNTKDCVKRCSIILPLSWVKVFWNSFVSHGAHAIGLREKHWVACEIGLPYFPLDYPDCNAYWCIMAKEAVASDQKTMLCPPSKRPLEIPIPPPWGCMHPKFFKLSSESGKSFSQVEQPSFENEVVDSGISEANGVPFEGVVARTSLNLHDYLNAISGNDFLLFPRIKDQKNCMHKFMKDGEFLRKDTIMKYGKTRCFLRVVLRAYKEGVFEQGAVVCAPHAEDLTLWTRLESGGQQLQIPQSSLRSYFVKLPSGNWELQSPLDPADEESFRWPVGFVTTGFVRGSKKAVAGALCEASLLSKLRLEQWKVLPVRQRRKEIYVLVRNMRSTAFRLALASIVLEQEEEDVKFM